MFNDGIREATEGIKNSIKDTQLFKNTEGKIYDKPAIEYDRPFDFDKFNPFEDKGNGLEEVHSLTSKEVDGKIQYYDDNDNLVRIDKDLKPNNIYEINGYKYYTDELGRIVKVEGELHLKTHEGRLPIVDSIKDVGKGDQQEGDDRGHLIGDQFGGSNGLENLIPQNAEVNRGSFKNLENELAKQLKDGKEIYVKVKPDYEGDSNRPSSITIKYTIDGSTQVQTFPNERST